MPIRGKDRKVKYTEAVERNVKGISSNKKKYKTMSLAEAKQSLGVRKDDNSYDEQISKYVKKKGKKKSECGSP